VATDVVQETVDPTQVEETTTTTGMQKVPGQIDPYGNRDGLSRSEKRRMNDLDADAKLERVYNFVENQQSQLLEQEKADYFKSNSKELSDDARTLAQDSYAKEYQELIDLGADPQKAMEKAMRLSVSSAETAVKQQEEVKRAEARNGASLPPTSGAVPAKTVYLNSEICNMSPQEGAAMRNKARAGEISIEMDF